MIRLNGWKEIANHLGKGVRTVQRWEKQLRLPIHRIGEGQGEIVFAFAHEIAEWTAEQEQRRRQYDGVVSGDQRSEDEVAPEDGPDSVVPEAQDSPLGPESRGAEGAESEPKRMAAMRSIAYLLLPASLIVGILLVWIGQSRNTGSFVGQPATWKVADQALLVFEDTGRLLWRYPFEGRVTEREYAAAVTNWSGPVAIFDLDGDGSREVVVATVGLDPQVRTKLRCFNADGSLRWVRQLDDRVSFGSKEYAPPWPSLRFLVTREARRQGTVWAVFIHGLEFPTVLEQIDAEGRVVSRYWSNGYIDWVVESVWQGRAVMLIGAVNNEHKGASLVILDRAAATAVAPAADPAYSCSTCGEGRPLEFVVFPPTEIGRIRGDGTTVDNAWVRDEGLAVTMRDAVPLRNLDGHVVFTLDRFLRPESVAPSVSYRQMHDVLFASGDFDHPFGPEDERKLLRVLRWDGTAFVEMNGNGPSTAEGNANNPTSVAAR